MDEAQIDEVLRMLPYASREDVMKDLTITQSVELTINRILDGQVRLNKCNVKNIVTHPVPGLSLVRRRSRRH